jgi:hypothetical protein
MQHCLARRYVFFIFLLCKYFQLRGCETLSASCLSVTWCFALRARCVFILLLTVLLEPTVADTTKGEMILYSDIACLLRFV